MANFPGNITVKPKLETQEDDVKKEGNTSIINFEDNLDVVSEGNGKVTVKAMNEGEGFDERFIHVTCVPGTNCVADISIMVDQTQCYIKSEEC